ncbi:MAG: potassium channel family protein [Thermoleophilaceae bacterium]|nr:potassium channel family protein [Thermoleophilaceae bacterium]
MSKARVEAFSDGVMAIAITLLILEIKVPTGAGQDLPRQLLDQWPSYVSYVVSFVVIGVIWLNHHALFMHLTRVDRKLTALNLVLLFSVALIPWPTHLLAEYMREGGGAERVSALIYSGTMLLMGVAFAAIWTYASRDRRLLGSDLTDEDLRSRTRSFTIGAPIYLLALIVALFSAPLCLAINALLAVYYASPGLGMMRHPEV